MENDSITPKGPGDFCDRWLSLTQIALDNSLDGIVIHDPAGRLMYFNKAAARNSGYTSEEFAALPAWGFGGIATVRERRKRMETLAREGKGVFISDRILPNGEPLKLEVHATYVETEDGPVVVAVSHDVTERVRAAEALRHFAFHDALTDLANRALFDDRLAMAIASSRRNNRSFGVIYLDVDDLKTINDRFGHAVGDLVLRELADRIRQGLRAEDTVARMGGDEFALILPNIFSAEDLRALAGKIADHFSEPLLAEGNELSISASIGMAMFDCASDDARSVVTRADIDMYNSKRAHPSARSTA